MPDKSPLEEIEAQACTAFERTRALRRHLHAIQVETGAVIKGDEEVRHAAIGLRAATFSLWEEAVKIKRLADEIAGKVESL